MASLAESIVGHRKILQSWNHALKTQTLSHAFLLTGPDGVGRKAAAIAFFQQINCESPTYSQLACGLCGSCVRISKLQSEALMMIAPQKNQIKIEETRQILDFLSLSKVSKSRAILIEDAHLLNPQAGNLLLKVLEEPPPDTYFFLIAPTPAQVLATLRSRSQIVSFSGLIPEELKSLLPLSPDWVVRASRGSVSQAKVLMSKDNQELRGFALRLIQDWSDGQSIGQISVGYEDLKSNLKDRESGLQMFHFLQSFLRDIFVLQSNQHVTDGRFLLNPDQLMALQKVAGKVDNEKTSQFCQALLSLEHSALRQDDLLLQFERVWIGVVNR